MIFKFNTYLFQPKLSLSSVLLTPKSVLKKRSQSTSVIQRNELFPSEKQQKIQLIPRKESELFVPRNDGPPNANPKYWTPFLKKKVFEHISASNVQRFHILNPDENVLIPTKMPSLKKLKKCGRYTLKWKTKDSNEAEIDIAIHVIINLIIFINNDGYIFREMLFRQAVRVSVFNSMILKKPVEI